MRTVVTVVCPACFEEFSLVPPPPDELPAEWDYDCEICCRPMLIAFDDDDDGNVSAVARSLAD
jgi:hypothetical protein